MELPFDFVTKVSFTASGFAHLVFFVMAALTAIVSVVFFFHWRKYAVGSTGVIAITEVVYLAVSVVLLGVAFFSLN